MNIERPRVAMLFRGNADHLPPSRRMAEALVARGVEVDFYTARPRRPRPSEVRGVRYIELPFEPGLLPRVRQKFGRELSWSRKFLGDTAKRGYSLFYAHNGDAVPLTALVAARARVPWVYQSHELWSWAESRGAGVSRLYALLEPLASLASLVLCPEPTRVPYLSRRLHLRQPPTIVRNAMPLTAVVESNYLRDFVTGNGGSARRIALFQGGLGGAEELRTAVESVAQWPADWALVLVGWCTPDVKQRIDGWRRNAGVERRVFVHEPVHHGDLWRVVCSADVGLVLYAHRTLGERHAAPNKLGEYLMAGLAIVYTGCEGLNALLEGRPFAVEANGNDARSFAIAASTFFDEQTLRSARLHARKFAEREYNFEVTSEAALRTIISLCADR